MIYPDTAGKCNHSELRLYTLESVWLQGKLRMWGRWSYIGGGKPGNMFNQLLVRKKITKTALTVALQHLTKAGLSKTELADYLADMMHGTHKSYLAFCTDSEALVIDGVIGQALRNFPGLLYIITKRYRGRGKSKKALAEALNEVHPEWCFKTCQRRIDTWLNLAEFILYKPMCDAFSTNSDRFKLNIVQKNG